MLGTLHFASCIYSVALFGRRRSQASPSSSPSIKITVTFSINGAMFTQAARNASLYCARGPSSTPRSNQKNSSRWNGSERIATKKDFMPYTKPQLWAVSYCKSCAAAFNSSSDLQWNACMVCGEWKDIVHWRNHRPDFPYLLCTRMRAPWHVKEHADLLKCINVINK